MCKSLLGQHSDERGLAEVPLETTCLPRPSWLQAAARLGESERAGDSSLGGCLSREFESRDGATGQDVQSIHAGADDASFGELVLRFQ